MSKKLLLADDSITIQKVIGITFSHEDYTLSVVDNGDAALEKARAQQPDLVLADVFMPGKNGYELCAAIKADPSLQQIPVLLLAGTFEPFDEAKARKAGADGWIAKPFESQALIDRVEELLARPRPVAIAPAAAAIAAESAAVIAAAPPVMAVQAVDDGDTEPDLWAELGPIEAPIIDTAESVTDALSEPLAPEGGALVDAGGIDDLWGEVSLGEEDLVPVAPAAAGNDIWGDLESPAATDDAGEPASLVADDLWEDLAAPAAPEPIVARGDQSVPAAAVEEAEEVFLTLEDEEETLDLLDPSAGDAEEEEAFVFVEDDDLAQDLSAAAAQPIEDATTFVAAEPDEEPLLELDDADIMALDDADILEEELELLEQPLELVEDDFAPTLAAESAESEVSFEDLELTALESVEEDELERVEAAAFAAEPGLSVAEEPMALDDAFDGLVLGELSPMDAEPEALAQEEPASLLVESQIDEEPLWDVVEPAMAESSMPDMDELIELEPEVAAAGTPVLPPITPVAPPAQTAAAVEAQVQSLSEADLSRIVERVAGEVIERLAGTILERMAWEVVPDLAETLIREEIRKIRDHVA